LYGDSSLFKDMPKQTAFKPTNTISHLIKERCHNEKEPEKFGIYKLTGHTFGKAYIGHTE